MTSLGLDDFTLFTNQVCLKRFHKYWEEIQDFWVRNKRLRYSRPLRVPLRHREGGLRQTPKHAAGCAPGETPTRRAYRLQQEVRQPAPPQRGTLLRFSKLFPESKALKNGPSEELSQPCILGAPGKVCGARRGHEEHLLRELGAHEAGMSDPRRYSRRELDPYASVRLASAPARDLEQPPFNPGWILEPEH